MFEYICSPHKYLYVRYATFWYCGQGSFVLVKRKKSGAKQEKKIKHRMYVVLCQTFSTRKRASRKFVVFCVRYKHRHGTRTNFETQVAFIVYVVLIYSACFLEQPTPVGEGIQYEYQTSVREMVFLLSMKCNFTRKTQLKRTMRFLLRVTAISLLLFATYPPETEASKPSRFPRRSILSKNSSAGRRRLQQSTASMDIVGSAQSLYTGEIRCVLYVQALSSTCLI